ncbi:hypothetical protein [Bacillus safensis]|uniref:hypothetical protein n=1 Tax=Bacillus safensis TaxID=561879 RepID=UPI002E1BD036|nr:hypothetical protein [Bacillus safensis]
MKMSKDEINVELFDEVTRLKRLLQEKKEETEVLKEKLDFLEKQDLLFAMSLSELLKDNKMINPNELKKAYEDASNEEVLASYGLTTLRTIKNSKYSNKTL